MTPVAIFCKSYGPDLERAAAFVDSVRAYNRDGLPLCIAVPETDLEVFRCRIGSDLYWMTDEEIVSLNSAIDMQAFAAMPGHLSQQVVKAEFWRTGLAMNCVCVDSDSRFIRAFSAADFLTAEGTPYTVLHEAKDYLAFCLSAGLEPALEGFRAAAQQMKALHGRSGPDYNFGPFPVIWSTAVWRLLGEHLADRGQTIVDAIRLHPHEASWYGETLLRHRPIELVPIGPLFRAYLYLEEYEHDRRAGLDERALGRLYLGVVYQSNWYPKRLKTHKRLAYKAKRFVQRRKRA